MNDRAASCDAGPPEGPREDLRQLLADAYDACADSLFRYAAAILADGNDAQDAVHQVFAKLSAMGSRVGDIHATVGYLRRAVRNECYRLLEQQARRRRLPGELREVAPWLQAPAADESMASRETLQALERALRQLPPDQREVIHMKIYEKKTFEEISQTLAVSINTASSRYRYALARLSKLLAAIGETQR